MQEPLKISPETAEPLAAQARARGLSVEEYLKSLLGVSRAMESGSGSTLEEFMTAMEAFAEDLKPLPNVFSREDVYFDRD